MELAPEGDPQELVVVEDDYSVTAIRHLWKIQQFLAVRNGECCARHSGLDRTCEGLLCNIDSGGNLPPGQGRFTTDGDTMLKTKSIHSPIDLPNDGLRILIARFRGRGMSASRYHVWMANLGPSEKLLRAFQSGKVQWKEYVRRYTKELFEGGTIDSRNRTIKNHGQKFTLRLIRELSRRGTVTLMCHCAEDEMHCHRHVLKKIVSRI